MFLQVNVKKKSLHLLLTQFSPPAVFKNATTYEYLDAPDFTQKVGNMSSHLMMYEAHNDFQKASKRWVKFKRLFWVECDEKSDMSENQTNPLVLGFMNL